MLKFPRYAGLTCSWKSPRKSPRGMLVQSSFYRFSLKAVSYLCKLGVDNKKLRGLVIFSSSVVFDRLALGHVR
jgi:hypothetical protein